MRKESAHSSHLSLPKKGIGQLRGVHLSRRLPITNKHYVHGDYGATLKSQ